jgi:hypothetical protein
VDPALVEDIERQARRLATDLDSVVENLSCILQSISALTVDTVETYRYSGRTFPASSSPYLPSLWTL